MVESMHIQNHFALFIQTRTLLNYSISLLFLVVRSLMEAAPKVPWGYRQEAKGAYDHSVGQAPLFELSTRAG